jgi:hypothetical protein
MYLQLYGERHSGTNWLRRLLSDNFVKGQDKDLIENTHVVDGRLFEDCGWKHGFFDKGLKDADTSNTLFLAIFRDPYEWLVSMYRYPYHVHPSLRSLPFLQFICTEWYCIHDHDSALRDGSEIMTERNPTTGERFRNVIELRKTKINDLLSLQDHVENFHILRYEDLLIDPRIQLELIAEKFGLKMVDDEDITCNVDVSKRVPTPFPPFISKNVTDLLDWNLETKLGYIPKVK